jgi:long-chain acyl-CoA synthetase
VWRGAVTRLSFARGGMQHTNANFAVFVQATCERLPDRPALLHRGGWISYRDLGRQIDAWVGALRQAGAAPGRCVAIWLPNSPAFVAAFVASLRLGAVAAPLGILLKPREVRQRLDVAGAAVVVTTPALARDLADVAASVVAVDSAGLAVDGGGTAASAAVARLHDDAAVLIFTSGTTGDAKAAELTHGGIAWNARALADAFAMTADDVQLAAAPLSHVLGMTGVMGASLITGGAVALMDRFDAPAALALLASAGITGVVGAPPMFVALLREAHKAGGAPRLRFALAGGAALATEVARSIEETFQCALREGYGMSEVGGGIAGASLTSPRKPRSVGPAFPGSEIRIVDVVTHAPLPIGERGEVQVRSPSVMRGYRLDEDGTKAVIDADGWLSTGDIGYVDDDGYLFLVDRKKDLIIRSGYNVYPGEVEEVLLSCPGVLEAAVVGVPDEDHGEEVVALVVPAGVGVDPEAVKAFARERLAAYKYPRRVIVVNELPKGPTGKISKRDIDLAAVIAR